MRSRPSLVAFALASLLALPAWGADATEFTVKISLSRKDPNVSAGDHAGTDPVEFYVFVDGHPTRGGEFGLRLEGAECLGFEPDVDLPWVTMPMVRPYPGTIAQATAGDDCHDPPVCFGKLLVKPAKPGGRIVVDVIPSVRAKEVTLLKCDLSSATAFVAYPAVVNKGTQAAPAAHVVERPPDAPKVAPGAKAAAGGEATGANAATTSRADSSRAKTPAKPRK